jgi:hypothetical protein
MNTEAQRARPVLHEGGRVESGKEEERRTARRMATMSELREWSARGQRDWPRRDQPVPEWRRQDREEPVRIVQRTVGHAEVLDTPYGRLDMVCADCTVALVQRSKREPSVAVVDPEMQTRVLRLCHDVRVAVSIDVRDDKSDDEIVRAQMEPAARSREPNREQSGVAAWLNPIVEAIPVEIRPQRLCPSRSGNRQREETAECGSRVPADARRVCAEHDVGSRSPTTSTERL